MTQQPAFPVSGLLRWYRKHRRDLPWRPRKANKATAARRVTAYETLVSEQMCQQTQVATVVPYFHRFLEAFPTVYALADADEQQVLKLWQGLGYYRRARNLHAAAKMIVSQFGGELPGEVDPLLKLPGVGRYTAGAVASIAFDRPAPILDGNVMRVLARHDGIAEAIDPGPTQNRLWARAGELVERSPAGGRGDFNQAMMELGATVCLPSANAKCMFCPLRETCVAFATGRVASLPVKSPKRKPTAATHHIIAIFRREKLLFEQRPATGLWSNMWQLPTIEDALTIRDRRGAEHAEIPGAAEDRAPLRSRLVGHVAERLGLTVARPKRLSSFPHATTHRTITFVVHRCEATGGRLNAGAGVWRRADRLDDLPLAKPQLKALALLADGQS